GLQVLPDIIEEHGNGDLAVSRPLIVLELFHLIPARDVLLGAAIVLHTLKQLRRGLCIVDVDAPRLDQLLKLGIGEVSRRPRSALLPDGQGKKAHGHRQEDQPFPVEAVLTTALASAILIRFVVFLHKGWEGKWRTAPARSYHKGCPGANKGIHPGSRPPSVR